MGLQVNTQPHLFTQSLTATDITLSNNSTILGATSATSVGIGSLSARTFSLVHEPANDGVDPIIDIGETLAGSFFGFRIRYEEPTNRLVGSSRTGTTILTSFMITTNTGQVSISGLPAPSQALTVFGNISASGNILAANTPTFYYLDNNRAAISGSVVPSLSFTTFFDTSAALTLLPNKAYELEYNLYFSRNATTPIAFALSSTPSLNHVAAISLQSPTAGFSTPLLVNTPSASLGTGLISALPGSFIPMLSTSTLVANASYYVKFITQVETSVTGIPFTTLNVQVSAGSFGNTNTITPLKGSYYKATLLN